MANQEHLAILEEGLGVWNQWRAEHPRVIPDLSDAQLSDPQIERLNKFCFTKANLRGALLMGTDLWEADLRFADMRGAHFRKASLNSADLREANLTDANLLGVTLRSTDLSGANLTRAVLQAAILHNTKVLGADFTRASMFFTTLQDIDFSATEGLETVRHVGPSSIDIDTIYKSGGNISERFLRECGVPESFITQMHSLVNAKDGIQFYSCFISYSSKDEGFAERLHGKMRNAHLRVWFAPEDMKAGAKLHEQIETAIRVFDKLLVVLSEASLESEWVMDELRKGFKAEQDTGKRKLFPVRLTDYETLERWECRDSVSGKDLAEEVRQYFIPDFSNWKDHDQFETAFARLLKDLRAEERAA
jgi:hypothetical protein